MAYQYSTQKFGNGGNQYGMPPENNNVQPMPPANNGVNVQNADNPYFANNNVTGDPNNTPQQNGAVQAGLPPLDTTPPPQENWDNSPISGNNPYSPWTAYGNPNQEQNNYGSSWNGNPTAGATAGAADYEGVQDFSDAAYNNARRYLDPQQAFDNRRFDQELINRGIDPNSDYGRQMYEQMMRSHGDQDQGAAFGAMEFGQGIQEQMFRQNYDNTRQAGDMQKAQWADQSNRYGIDSGYKLGMGNLELGRQVQDFNEMGWYDSRDYRNQLYNDSRDDRYQDIALWMYEQGNPTGSWSGKGGENTSPWGDYIGDLRGIWGDG